MFHYFRLLPPLIWVPLIAVLLMSIGITALSEWSAWRASASSAQVAKVRHRLETMTQLDALLSDVQTGERGYLLTRDPAYLQPFVRAVSLLQPTQNLLRELSHNVPGADQRLAHLKALIDRRVADARASVEAFNAGRTAEAMSLVRSGDARRVSNEFQREIAAFEEASRLELLELRQAQADSALWSRVSLILMTLVTLGLLFLVARLFAAEAVRQKTLRTAAEHEAKELEKLVETRTRELSALSTHLQEFSEKEKSELAHNLHDELGGLLTAAKMDLSWLQGRLDQPAIQQRLSQLGMVLDEAMDLKRRVVEDLRPSLLEHFGLPTALRAHVESTAAKAGLKAEMAADDEDERVPRDIAIALFRVVQEALTNVIRHAEARRVRLELLTLGSSYRLRLEDDGRGMDPSNPEFRWSHGLTGMRHRVKALGGRFEIESAPQRGTIVKVEVPKRPADSVSDSTAVPTTSIGRPLRSL
jgi:signal transduction histidine kinase